MRFLAMIGKALQALIEIPNRILLTLYDWRQTRLQAARSVQEAGAELQPASKLKRFFRGVGRVVLWLLVIALVVGLFVGLWYLNYRLDLERRLGGPWPPLRKVWLPLLFLLLCVLGVLGRILWKLLGPDRAVTEFPDIDAAWGEARRALELAGLDVTRLPLFLVLGRPVGPIDTVFDAAKLTLAVQQTPRTLRPPLVVYASRQAIYVACPDTSLLGRYAALLAGEPDTGSEASAEEPPVQSLFADKEEAAPPPPAAPVEEPNLGGRNLLAEATNPSAAGTVPKPPELSAAPPRRPALLRKTSEIERLRARLRYLCKVLVRSRRPYCAVNGILVLVPFAATADDELANQTATVCHQDLVDARAILRVECPVFALVCDLETAPGFSDFLKQIPEGRHQRLLGQAFPLRPSLPPAEVPRLFESGVQWTGQALGVLIYKLFRQEAPDATLHDVSRVNGRLFQLVAAVQERQPRLGRILRHAFVSEKGVPLWCGGCYLAGTGADATSGQGFVAGVFRLLVENQNWVAWTPEAVAEEASYRRWTLWGYTGLACFIIALGFCLLFRERMW